MAATQSWADLNTLYTAISEARIPNLIKSIALNAHPVLAMFKNQGKIKKLNEPGMELTFPIGIGQSPQGAFDDPNRVETFEEADTLRTVAFPWSYYVDNMAFSQKDLNKNKGRAKKVDLIDARQQQYIGTLGEKLATAFFGASAGTATGPNVPFGLQDACSKYGTGVYPSTYGGLNKNTYTDWNAQVKVSDGLGSLVSNMGYVYRNCTQDDGPDLIVTDLMGHQLYEDSMAGDIRYNDLDTGDAGFKGLDFKGTSVVWDRACAPLTSAPTGWSGTPDAANTHRMYFVKVAPFLWVFDPEWTLDQFGKGGLTNAEVTGRRSMTRVDTLAHQFFCKSPKDQGLLSAIPES